MKYMVSFSCWEKSGDYCVTNYNGHKFIQDVSLRRAMAYARTIPAITGTNEAVFVSGPGALFVVFPELFSTEYAARSVRVK